MVRSISRSYGEVNNWIQFDKGYIYSLWNPIGGIWSEEYNPRGSTEEEIKTLIGDSGGYEKLLPEESIVGCLAFEVRGQPYEVSRISGPCSTIFFSFLWRVWVTLRRTS